MSQDPQLDITYYGQDFLSLPKFLPGRLNSDDFVYFNIPASINQNDYMVVVKSNDVARNNAFRTISVLREWVELPAVYFGGDSIVSVIPKTNPNLSSFHSRLNRGSTYDIPNVNKYGGSYDMIRHGVSTMISYL